MNRRDLLKLAATSVFAAPLAKVFGSQPESEVQFKTPSQKGKSVVGFRAPKLDKVRVAFIGMGARGPSHLDSCMACEGVEVIAICDNHLPSAESGRKMVLDAKRPEPTMYTKGEYDYRRMLERDDIDAVFISTPWEWHARMAIDTMKAGKHAFVEVPMCVNMKEIWDIVDTAEKTQKHCMMMENVCYGREELMVLNMCRMGVFGELLHGEAAYIHDLRDQMFEIEHGTGSWRTLHYTKRNGNIYPTHGLGPVCQYMNINRGDRLDYLCSVSSNSRVREIFAREHFPEGHARRNLKFICGDINTSIVRTVLGKTIMIQWDEQLPRPYTRHNLIQGTRGCYAGFPDRAAIEKVTKATDSWTQGANLKDIRDKYDHPLYKKLEAESQKHGGHGGMDFVMVWRIIYCLRNGLEMDQSIYDSAAWTAVSPLSEYSVAHRGKSVDFPDFTRGAWKTTPPLGIVTG